MKKLNEKAFTLAELLIVVAIIAVLVAIAIPIFSYQLEKSREAVDIQNMRIAKSQIVLKAFQDPDFKEIKDPNGAVSYGDSGWYVYNFKTNSLDPYTSSLGGSGYKGLVSTKAKGNTDFSQLGITLLSDMDSGSASSSYMLVGYKDGQVYIRLDSQGAEGPTNTGNQKAVTGRPVPKGGTPAGGTGPKPNPQGQPTPPPKKP